MLNKKIDQYEWVSLLQNVLAAHRYFIILKNCLELSDVSDELLQAISSSLASSAVLSTLTREGRSFVYSVAPKTPHDRILA